MNDDRWCDVIRAVLTGTGDVGDGIELVCEMLSVLRRDRTIPEP
jgi:hypothetical protein